MELSLKIITPVASFGPYSCDSVHLTLSDDLEERGGGSMGIRAGHAKALLSLSEGPINCYQKDQCILSGRAGGGFAGVENNCVTVVVEHFEK